MNSFLICQGFSGLGMLSVVLGAVMNIILDPVFIFLLHMDVAGAAIATVISQICSCAFVLLALRRKRMPVPLGWGGLDLRLVGRVLSFGLSPFLTIATDSVLLIVLNTVLQRFGGPGLGDTLVTCATVVQSYLLVITMPLGGITLGTQPVISFNYGAGHPRRVRTAMRDIVLLCLGFVALMMVVTHTLSPLFVRLFTSDADLAARSVTYIKRFTCMIIPLGIQYPLVDESIALGQVNRALFCSLFRKTVFLAGLILLPLFFGAEATFFSEPIADVIAAAMSSILFLRAYPRVLRTCAPTGAGKRRGKRLLGAVFVSAGGAAPGSCLEAGGLELRPAAGQLYAGARKEKQIRGRRRTCASAIFLLPEQVLHDMIGTLGKLCGK